MISRRKPGRLAEYDRASGDRVVDSLRIQGSSYEKAFDRLAADPPLNFREWTDEELTELIARNPDVAPARLAASEVRRREAWQTPAKPALIVSLVAVGISAAAFALALAAFLVR